MTLTARDPHKTGARMKGTKVAQKITHVEDVICTGEQKHRLINDDERTYCVSCGQDWATLDTALNGSKR